MSFALVRSRGLSVGSERAIRRIVQGGDGHLLPRQVLRDSIPAAILMDILVDAATTGLVKRVDALTGEEIGPSQPIEPMEQLKLAESLLNKRLPAPKALEVEDERDGMDIGNIPTGKEDIKRMTLSQLSQAIEAQYEVSQSGAEVPTIGGGGSTTESSSLRIGTD